MDAVKVIYVSAIVFPFAATAWVMGFVWRSIKSRMEREKEKDDLIETLEDVVVSQDNLLGVYRKMSD